MIELLPKIFLNGHRPSFYDTESATVIELSANLHGKMNELINEYNAFAERINTQFNEFITATNKDYEVFRTAMRQEFQDFIDVVNLKIQSQDKKIDDAVKYMKTNLAVYATQAVENALAQYGVEMSTTYDEETEALTFVYVKAE